MIRTLLALFIFTLPLLARADLVGHYKLGSQSNVVVYYHDDQHIRVETPGKGYMLMTGGKMYTVVNRNGQTMVMDLQKMGEALKKYQQEHNPQPEKKTHPGKVTIKNTGKKEKVAGYQGVVHQVTYDGKTTDMVLTRNKDVAKMTQAFMDTMLKMGQALTNKANMDSRKVLQRIEKSGYGGLLKQQEGFELESLKHENKSASFYALPKDAQMVKVPNLGQ